MILIIDNYDSFSYNLYQMLGEINPDIKVVRNDKYTCEEIEAMQPTHLIISPGPGWPKDAGISEAAVRYFEGKLPILGVCLGHQGICEAYGGEIVHAKKLMHGKQSVITFAEDPIFDGLQKEEPVARYHSLAAEASKLPAELKVIATADDGEVMAVKHVDYPTYGMQFHPESVLTTNGRIMLENFLKIKL
ncbi:MAG: aminodeoxychorismate/anthranilate synthase component II [Lachnospiraceae bacterium]|nr:aminodeoxychorismate/anthranilate synthase component II [Lachnospiraceae bacterium]